MHVCSYRMGGLGIRLAARECFYHLSHLDGLGRSFKDANNLKLFFCLFLKRPMYVWVYAAPEEDNPLELGYG